MRQAVDYSPTLHRLDFEAQAADSEITLQRSAYMPKVVLRMEKPTGGINADNRTRAMLVLQAQPGAGLSAKAGVDAGLCAYQVRSTRFTIYTSGLTSAS